MQEKNVFQPTCRRITAIDQISPGKKKSGRKVVEDLPEFSWHSPVAVTEYRGNGPAMITSGERYWHCLKVRFISLLKTCLLSSLRNVLVTSSGKVVIRYYGLAEMTTEENATVEFSIG